MTDFTAIVERERGYLRTVCARALVMPDDAEDAVQDAFVRAWVARAKMPVAPVEQRHWLTAIARNGCYDRNRRGQVRHRYLARCRSEASFDPAHEAMVWIALRETDAACGMLGERDRTALGMSIGLSSAEMGARLGVTANAAKLRVYLAREHLAARLGEAA